MRKNATVLALIIAIVLAITGCNRGVTNNEMNHEEKEKLKIFTSFYPMYFIAKEIAQDKAEIINMIPAGVEPHDWEPTLKTMAQLQESDIFIYNGAGMERWVDRVIENMDTERSKIVEASKGIELISGEEDHEDEDHEDEHDHGNYDPHVWVSPMNLKKQALNVLNALIEKDGSNEDYYRANYNNLISRLDALDNDIREASKSFKTNIIVTSHEAFGYFAKEYNLKQIPIRGISPQQEPSPAKIAEIVKLCRENNIKYIFVEKFVNPKYSETIANEIDGEVLTLNAVHGLTQEEMDKGMDYITIMYENLENLKKALQ
ncbi:metal ABC transporter substrate-binding protein [Lutispora thermophila]|uniref:Zinc transport system substrate-binding protein n=1 Tax=Lutispora thermophila DSM 19022 TaxID=1122184 RepID=A0A1M6DTT9_9FIRM|nr:metal ABC transporter substrate-binding protein [Lutispora thermophila]SHI76583.1 zinc transport system substrate-binding protein [Lutispora thermophila DSM 19022]